MSTRGRRPGRCRRALVLPGLALTSLLAACGNPSEASTTTVTLVPTPGGTTTVGIAQAPTGCNPNTASGNTWANHLVLEAVLPSTFIVNPSGQSAANQALVASAEPISLSPLTVVYALNPKAVWQDGVPITADDFIYAWHQQRGGEVGAGAGAEPTAADGTSIVDPTAADAASSLGYRDIKSVTGSNHGRTVKVVFKTPFSDWQMLFHDLLPAHVMERGGVGWDPPCTSVDPAVDLSGGPYRIRSVVPGRAVVLVANPRWWGVAPNLTRITIRTATGPAQLAQWERRGQAQVIEPTAFDGTFLESVTSDRSAMGNVSISSTFLQLEFSTTAPATSIAGVRQAVAHAIDRQALVTSVVGFADSHIVPSASHLYVQTQGPYPAGAGATGGVNPLDAGNQVGVTTTTAPGSPGAYPPRADLRSAARLLTAAGFTTNVAGGWVDPQGAPFTLRLVYDAGDPWARQTAPLLMRQLEQVGMAVVATAAVSATAAGVVLSSGAADMALMPFATSPYPTQAIAWYTPSLGPPGVNGSENWSNLDDPLLTSTLTRAAGELNPVTAQPLYAQADQMLWSSMVALPLFAVPSALIWSDRLSAVTPNPEGSGLLWYPGAWENQVARSVASGSGAG